MNHPSCVDIFKQNCNEIISNLDPNDIVKANKMVSSVVSISKKNNFVFFPDFIEDFMNGMFTRDMISKYRIRDYNDFTVASTALKFNGLRSKSPDLNNKKINLQNAQWAKQYEFLESQMPFFNSAFLDLFNCNILNHLVSNAILESEYIGRSDLKGIILDMYEKLKDKSILCSETLSESFANYISDDLENKLSRIIGYMAQESYLTCIDEDISLPRKYLAVSEYVYDLIDIMKDGISYSGIQTKILREFPLFESVSASKKLDELLIDLETNQKIIINKAHWKYSPYSDQLFTIPNYDAKMKKIKTELISAGRTKFFGRNINPDQFISELKTMESGDLDDLDDQVTRIAGLVLSDAALLRNPKENMLEFDFIVDLTNYNFRPEQEKMMKNLDFKAFSNIFHCKVMINDKITEDILAHLKEIIPKGEQAVIFTCMPINPKILEKIKKDKTVQIIAEDGIRNWCSVTPTIPCRRHSVGRVMYGDGIGKIVMIKSLNYESGLAIVNTAPDRMETTFPIGCLQEVDLMLDPSDNFEMASETYFDFVCLLANLSPDSFDEGIKADVIAIHRTYNDLMKNIHPEQFDGAHPTISYSGGEHGNIRYVEFDNTYTKITLDKYSNNSFDCECSHKLNEEYDHTLCNHLIASINHICIDTLDWSGINRNIEMFKKKFIRFQEDNIKRITGAIYDVIEPDSQSLFTDYLQTHVNED